MAVSKERYKDIANTCDYVYKFLLIGESGVGKTSLLLRYSGNSFSSSFVSTTGVDFKLKTIQLDGKNIKLVIWDTAGQERFQTLTSAFYRDVNGVLLIYDITNERSFEKIKSWMRNIEERASSDVERIILGNKCDLEDERQVSKERGEQMAIEYSINFIETSAKASINVEGAFLMLASEINASTKKKEPLPQEPQRKSFFSRWGCNIL